MNPETRLERKFDAGVRRLGGFTEKLTSGRAGIPDRLVLWPHGRLELAELKTDAGDLRAVQVAWIAQAARRGHVVRVLRGEAGVEAYLAEAEDRLSRLDATQADE